MEYTIDGFIKLYDENKKFEGVISRDIQEIQERENKKLQLGEYGIALLQNNPNNKEIACIVYSGLPLKCGAYSSLSAEVRNDKLVTLFALEKFDGTISGENIGKNLRNDREVMFSFARNTVGVGSVVYFSDELKKDKNFWVDLLTYAYVSPSNSLGYALYQLQQINNHLNLNLDFNVINAAAAEVKAKGHEQGDSIYNCEISAMNLVGCSPHFMDEVLKGNVEYVSNEQNFLNFGLAHELYVSEAKKYQEKAMSSEMTSSLNKFDNVSNVQEETTINIPLESEPQDNIEEQKSPFSISAEEFETRKKTYDSLKMLESLNPDILSSEQKNFILETEAYLQTMGVQEETSEFTK